MAIAVAGYVDCPTDAVLYYELLPIAGGGRTIQPEGVQIDYLTYNAEILYRYRKARSPYPDGLWPIRRDPRNLLHAYFRDPADGRWHVLRWTHALGEHQPFTDVTHREARRLIASHGRNPADQDEMAAALLELQNRTDAPETWTRTARHGGPATLTVVEPNAVTPTAPRPLTRTRHRSSSNPRTRTTDWTWTRCGLRTSGTLTTR
ncbi:hypothetical protein GCM10010174_66520 [Kutzneria viridogrisea]|uniref:Uncharacterized protein n=1 Tax=Kutzneria viridogrisea TaxID=47990 RepID=A0ABR6B9X7_9PSEU|nr:hypothetical protein [Kutzneria viridogrisea]